MDSVKKRRVESDPYNELAVKNAKSVRNCTEMFLAGRKIEKIRGFETFVNIEVLWLQNNKLTKINNLDGNIRIKFLYAHDNRIRTLNGSLANFKFLTELTLFNNELSDLNKQLDILSRFQYLKKLDLYGCPVAEEKYYRLRVITAVPSIEILDNLQVSEEERLQAARFKKFIREKEERLKKGLGKQGGGNEEDDEDDEFSDDEDASEADMVWIGTAKIIMEEARRIRQEQIEMEQKQRILLAQQAMKSKNQSGVEGFNDVDSFNDLVDLLTPSSQSFLYAEMNKKPEELGAWDRYYMKRLFQQAAHGDDQESEGKGGDDSKDMATLSKKELIELLESMLDTGRCLSEESRLNLDSLFDAIDVNDDDQIGWKEFLGAVTGSTALHHPETGDPIPPLHWEEAPLGVLRERATELFNTASRLHHKAMAVIVGSGDDRDAQRRKKLLEKAHVLSQTATRLTQLIVDRENGIDKEDETTRQGKSSSPELPKTFSSPSQVPQYASRTDSWGYFTVNRSIDYESKEEKEDTRGSTAQYSDTINTTLSSSGLLDDTSEESNATSVRDMEEKRLAERRRQRRLKASKVLNDFDLSKTSEEVKKYCTTAQNRKDVGAGTHSLQDLQNGKRNVRSTYKTLRI